MSKFGDKLSRLHGSRVRALEAGDGAEQRVFHADPPDAAAASAAPNPATATATAKITTTDSAARRSVREQLELGHRLEARSTRPTRVTMVREGTPVSRAPVPAAAPAPVEHENAVGERIGELRRQAEALIAAGGLDAALPLLHELVALSPTHPYALAQLSSYWRARGQNQMADLYAQRLAAAAPY